MRKRVWALSLVAIMMIVSFSGFCYGEADTGLSNIQSESAILMEESTGEILYRQNEHKPLPPASVTKMMVMLLAMEALDSGRIKLTDQVTASPEACRMGGSQIWLEPGEVMMVSDLMKSICIVSANDASYAMAEHLAGSEERFIAQMNKRGEELGLKNTRFINTTGLTPDDGSEGNITSAYDMALLARELLKHPKVLQWTGTWLDSVRGGNSYLRNTNNLVRFYNGCDGLKTGFTEQAGFCLVATAKREGVRMIAVIMKAANSKIRSREIGRLFNYGFSLYQSVPIYPAGKKLGEVKVLLGNETKVDAILPQELTLVVRRDSDGEKKTVVELQPVIKAPIKKGQVLGKARILMNDKEQACVELVAAQDVNSLGVIRSWWRLFRSFFGQMFEDGK